MTDERPTAHELNVLRRFKLKVGSKRFTVSSFAKFFYEESTKINYIESRKRSKIIIDYEMKCRRIEYSDKAKTKFRFKQHELSVPNFVINRCNVVGTLFKDLYIIKRLKFIREDKYKCYMCGYNPKYLQTRLLVNTPYGVTRVIMCSSCNKVITEE